MSLRIPAPFLVVGSGGSRGQGSSFKWERSSFSSRGSIEEDHRTENTTESSHSVATIKHSNISTTGRAMADYQRAKSMIEAYIALYNMQALADLLEDGESFARIIRRKVQNVVTANVTDEQICQFGQEYLDLPPEVVGVARAADEVSLMATVGSAETYQGNNNNNNTGVAVAASEAVGNDVASVVAGQDAASSSSRNWEYGSIGTFLVGGGPSVPKRRKSWC
jgi:hypothetical protein